MGVDLAIKSVKVKGSVIGSQILAGFNPVGPGMSDNADAQIDDHRGWRLIASSVAAGVSSTDAYFEMETTSSSVLPTIGNHLADREYGDRGAGRWIYGGWGSLRLVAQQIGKIEVGDSR